MQMAAVAQACVLLLVGPKTFFDARTLDFQILNGTSL